MRRIQLTTRPVHVAAATAALFLAVGVPAVASAATPAASSVTCVPQAHSDDSWSSGYCLHGGAAIAYQEHVKCSNGKTYDGNIVTSANGSPESKATCLGASNFVFTASITHT
jgi:hypothetical protein